MAAPDADGKVRHRVAIGEKLVVKEVVTIKKGACVVIMKGVHVGMYGKIATQRGDIIDVVLALGSVKVTVPELDLKPVPRAEFVTNSPHPLRFWLTREH